MASVKKRKGSKYWVGCYSLPNGERKQSSTKQRDKSKALQVAIGWEKAAKSHAGIEQAKKILNEIVKSVSGESYVEVNARDAMRGWLKGKSQGTSEDTSDRYDGIVGEFIKFVPEEIKFSQVTKKMLVDFRDTVAARSTPSNANQYLKIIRTMFKESHLDGVILEDPAATVRKLKEQKKEKKPEFSFAQELKLIQTAEGEWLGMTLFGSYTGQRMKDCVNASAEQIKGDVWGFTSSKTGRYMEIPLAQPLLDWISEQKIETGPLFPTLQKKKASSLSGMFYRVMVAAGLVPKRNNKKSLGVGRGAPRQRSGISYHSYRHSMTTKLKGKGVSNAIAMEFVGHESEAVSRGYTHIPLTILRDAAKLIPLIQPTEAVA